MKVVIGAAAVVLLLLAAEMIREFFCFRVTRYNICPAKEARAGKKHRALFLSDLHNRVYGKDQRRLLGAIRREKPEVILIGGDMLIGKKGSDPQAAVRLVQALAEISPVYYANGNHEQRMKKYPEKYQDVYEKYKRTLQSAGVHFLENDSAKIKLGDMDVQITGVEIPYACYARFQEKELTQDELRERIGMPSGQAFQILLAHNPAYTEAYLEWGADLVLSGHYHGGIVRIPGLGGLISPGFRIFPPYSGGIYQKDGRVAVVSRGLGCHTIPVRLFNPAELIVLEISET